MRSLIPAVLTAIACVTFCGCGTIPSYESKGGHYVEATYTRPGLWEPSGHRMALCYEYGDGLWHSVIWPDTFGIHVTNGVAVFGAYIAGRLPKADGAAETELRVFAVRAPDLPLDITDGILRYWLQQAGNDSTNLLPTASYVEAEDTNGAIEFHFACYRPPDWPSIRVALDWNHISDIMREVKEKGVTRKDPVQHKDYIEQVYTMPNTALEPTATAP